MNKEQQAVIQGLVITVLVVGLLTAIWAAYVHLFPKTWEWLKTSISFLNYSFGLYLGMLSASLRIKSSRINAPLFVMLIFFFLNIFLRVIFVTDSISYWLVTLKFLYSSLLLIVAYRQAKILQNKQNSYSYSRLR